MKDTVKTMKRQATHWENIFKIFIWKNTVSNIGISNIGMITTQEYENHHPMGKRRGKIWILHQRKFRDSYWAYGKILPIGNCGLKQWHHHTPARMIKPRKPKIPSDGKDTRTVIRSRLDAKWQSTWKTVSHKAKHCFLWSSKRVPKDLANRTECTNTRRLNVHNSFIPSCQNSEAIRMLSSRWTAKETVG